ncbi:hypothetical protein EDC04DRAFT_1245398 [Pisolithus marmoratus]|nr:hypothetical protein EDC04DRAFT_1245398 [Pisolithus marmoratus]
MDELMQARTALAALEKREQELINELCNIRDAARFQRSRVKELVAQMPISPINCLPAELLLQAFKFYLEAVPDTCDVYRHSKRELASVSRRWRDVILHSPSLWTTINVTSYWSEARAKTYVARSSQSLLDINFRRWNVNRDERIFTALFNVLASSAHRWRSFTIQPNISDLHRSLLLEKLNHLSFPSLKRVSIWKFPGSFAWQAEPYEPIFLHPESSPHLERVHLQVNMRTFDTFHVPSSTSALSLDFSGFHLDRHPSIFESHLYRGLTSLHIFGDPVDSSLPPDCIQLPLLEEFTCKVERGRALIHALVAPNLKHFDYSPRLWRDSPTKVFADLNSRFTNVDYLRLSDFTAENLSKAVCLAFPNVCHLELTRVTRNTFGTCRAEFPNDVLYWNNLKSLTLHGLLSDDLKFLDVLVTFLRQRLNAGQTKLHVKVAFLLGGVSSLFRGVPEYCYLELLDRFGEVFCRSGSEAWEY